jgi:hypothetical protein
VWGWLLWDEQRSVRVAMARVIPHITDLTGADAVALWHGVNLCFDLGLQQVLFEGDSLRVV